MSKLAFLFPGQGSQYVGMGKEYWNSYGIAKELFEEANETLGFNLQKMCFNSDISTLTQTMNAQPAILTVSVITFKIYMQEIGIEPAYLAGHSLGEYSALVCSGKIAFTDALTIVRKRGELMQFTTDPKMGAMAAVIGETKDVLEILCNQISTEQQPVVIACHNSPTQNVISGHREAVHKVIEKLKDWNIKTAYLKVSAPFHSPLMLEASHKLVSELSKYKYNHWKWPVISNVTALPYGYNESLEVLLQQQMVAPVRWMDTLLYLQQQGINEMVELGPKKVLSELVMQTLTSAHTYPITDSSSLQEIRKELGGMAAHSQKSLEWMEACWTIAVTTRNRNWNDEEYWNDVVVNCNLMREIIGDVEKVKAPPTLEQIQKIQILLETVLSAKKLPIEEKKRIKKEIN
ncbi:ACP S-malonyltransferase [Paenibacillus polymyxa]|uniref:ACP S-malonyltransferase n=1 Tax=Paenibacillus polymyxa TaxID=1406 RepID=UPI00234A7703|nr:ACP S-malonyltransferase [Paenibacillus polymyxa]WCM63687.1 ACP S-malonyltransferase [Paenibacillus polymyxa]